jgi:hypothetical protein
MAESGLARDSEEDGEPVTLCIAAQCEFQDSPAAVLCFDWRAQTGDPAHLLVGTEDNYKLREIGAASVLLAGRPTMAIELLTKCSDALRKLMDAAGGSPAPEDDLLVSELLQELREKARERKGQIVRDHVGMTLGLSFEEFKAMSPDSFHETWSEIKSLNLGADLLIVCPGSSEPIIIRLDRWGQTHWENNYSAIGEGSQIARAMLCLQPWDSLGWPNGAGPRLPSLKQCLYRVYEAKRAAHMADPSSVGEKTGCQVLTRGEKFTISQDVLESLDGAFNLKHRVPGNDGTRALAPTLYLKDEDLLTEDT